MKYSVNFPRYHYWHHSLSIGSGRIWNCLRTYGQQLLQPIENPLGVDDTFIFLSIQFIIMEVSLKNICYEFTSYRSSSPFFGFFDGLPCLGRSSLLGLLFDVDAADVLGFCFFALALSTDDFRLRLAITSSSELESSDASSLAEPFFPFSFSAGVDCLALRRLDDDGPDFELSLFAVEPRFGRPAPRLEIATFSLSLLSGSSSIYFFAAAVRIRPIFDGTCCYTKYMNSNFFQQKNTLNFYLCKNRKNFGSMWFSFEEMKFVFLIFSTTEKTELHSRLLIISKMAAIYNTICIEFLLQYSLNPTL